MQKRGGYKKLANSVKKIWNRPDNLFFLSCSIMAIS